MPMPAPFLLDLSHTSHTRARTGIQRVVRSLRAALSDRAVGITFDPYLEAWRMLQPWEIENLESTAPALKRGAQWPWRAKLRGRAKRAFSAQSNDLLPVQAAGTIVPELFSPAVAAALPDLFSRGSGPRVALFHDAIALKLPELTPKKTVARFPAYLRELLAFDGIAAVSDDSRAALVDYWRWLDVAQPPPVRTISLGVAIQGAESAVAVGTEPGAERSPRPTSSPDAPVVLSIGSIEGRKNHTALLEACEKLWAKGLRFELRLIGLAHPQTGAAAMEMIRRLQSAGQSLRCDGAVDDATVDAAYAASSLTVYPSLMEGFGLPVLESVGHGKPCVCSARGALGEAARGGGCVALDVVDPISIASTLGRLLADPAELGRLTIEAKARKLKSWADYATELADWMSTLRRR
jgi:glycosyltransferase involved in cell wall biosynthesis